MTTPPPRGVISPEEYLKGAPAAAPSPLAAEKTDVKRLTADIPTVLHKAMSYAKADTGSEIRVLVIEALAAHPAIARHLPDEFKPPTTTTE